MEPETSPPKLGSEQAPIQYRPNVERGPVLPAPERGIETGAERREQAAESSAVAADSGVMTMLPTPVVADTPAADVPTVSDTPIVANDDDLIEKEWVEKAKKIVAATRDDPYKREEAVNQLQKDYLMKRYGRVLGEA
ncbi:hypothetical protein H7X68_02885 [Candidatus Saccharibacteria bacterium]|nr:hypothetical protein [Candidatus Saccharibacteria bacterium]